MNVLDGQFRPRLLFPEGDHGPAGLNDRLLGTAYTNFHDTAIIALVCILLDNASLVAAAEVEALVDGNTQARLMADTGGTAHIVNILEMVLFIPSRSTYQVDDNSTPPAFASIQHWWEIVPQ